MFHYKKCSLYNLAIDKNVIKIAMGRKEAAFKEVFEAKDEVAK